MSLRLRHLLPAALLACALAAPGAQASFPGANGALAFPAGAGSIRNQDAVELFAADETGGLRRLAGGAGYQGAPAWSADGRRLAYASDGVLVVVTGADQRRLALGREASEPAWSPDGARLAFTSAGDVYTAGADGRAVRRVTADGANAAPAWSPGGTRLAYVHAGTLVTARPDGSARAPIADGVLQADWAPDGRRLVAVRRVGEHAELWVLDAASGAARRLTTGHDDLAARWSPDGRRVAFVRDGDVWTLALDGTGPRRVTTSGDVGAALAWQPLARFGAPSKRRHRRR
ncbi:MAG TPA: DPP IV N-terminal domain-containing protein [Solirubrobacteraceae bacterium]